MQNPALCFDVVCIGGLCRCEGLSTVGEGVAVHLEGEVATLGQGTTDGLEAVLD